MNEAAARDLRLDAIRVRVRLEIADQHEERPYCPPCDACTHEEQCNQWNIDLGVVAIPRSSNPERLAQNIDIFDFTLSADEIAAISALDTDAEKRVDSDTIGH